MFIFRAHPTKTLATSQIGSSLAFSSAIDHCVSNPALFDRHLPLCAVANVLRPLLFFGDDRFPPIGKELLLSVGNLWSTSCVQWSLSSWESFPIFFPLRATTCALNRQLGNLPHDHDIFFRSRWSLRFFQVPKLSSFRDGSLRHPPL